MLTKFVILSKVYCAVKDFTPRRTNIARYCDVSVRPFDTLTSALYRNVLGPYETTLYIAYNGDAFRLLLNEPRCLETFMPMSCSVTSLDAVIQCPCDNAVTCDLYNRAEDSGDGMHF